MSLRVFSSGGGVQSTAALVLSAQGKIDFPVHLFCNVGEDSENPETLEYVERYIKPYAAANGVEFHELRRTWRDGRDWTLYHELMQTDTLTAFIPIRLANGMPGRRGCTVNYKIRVVAKWCRERGATREERVVVGLGISLDEFQRMRTASGFDYQQLAYPLIDLRLDRAECRRIVLSAGLPTPPKSSCYFCPFAPLSRWRRLKRERPVLFEKSVALEQRINEKRQRQGKDEVYMTSALVPLDRAVGDWDQDELWDDEDSADACESGYCMT